MTTQEAVYWPAAYLARWFLRSWPYLWERAGWPLPGPVLDAGSACSQLDDHLALLGDDIDDDMLERRDTFVASHCLLAAAGGGIIPHLYLMREGSAVHVAWEDPSTGGSVRFWDSKGNAVIEAGLFLDATIEFMRWTRQTVAARSPGLAAEVAAWLAHVAAPEAAEAILRGYVRPWGVEGSRSEVRDLDRTLDLPAGWRSAGARLEPGRFAAAVVFRSVAPVLGAKDVEALLSRLRSCPARAEAAAELDRFRKGLWTSAREPAHLQGYGLAERVRKRLGNSDAYLDVEAVLRTYGVELLEEGLSDESIDAATVWDDSHGPVVMVNRTKRHTAPWARRMTLAHELCHLLIDRAEATPLMIVSTPWAPPEPERRANAFAAELLLPKSGMLRVLASELRTGRVSESARERLMKEFGVGETVCRHQLENRLRLS